MKVVGWPWHATGHFLLLFIPSLLLISAEVSAYPSIVKPSVSFVSTNFAYVPSIVKPPVSWNNYVPTNFTYWKSARLNPILLNGNFVCGFRCEFDGTTCLFAIFIFDYWLKSEIYDQQMVWSANRNDPLGLGAYLELSLEGDLTLHDVNGSLLWSTNTAGKSATGMKLTPAGNLVLFDRNNEVVWQSFDHPTDSLVAGQRLVSGQKLKSRISAENWSEGLYSFSIDDDGLFVASVGSDDTLVYYKSSVIQLKSQPGQFYAELTNSSFGFGADLSPGSQLSFIQLGYDGHLRSFGSVDSNLSVVNDLFHNQLGMCDYPLVCGKYGICSVDGCKCPEPNEFKPINFSKTYLGCSPYVPISCKSPFHHSLLEIKNVSCSVLFLPDNSHIITDIEGCKQACSNNCSCMFAAFQSNSSNSSGWCSFRSEALSLKRQVVTYYNYSSVFLKVQSSPIAQAPSRNLSPPVQIPQRKRKHNVGVILGITLGATFSLLLICVVFLLQIKKDPNNVDEDYLGHISVTLTRFSYEELTVATNNFSKKLGEGGFGCVFQGTLLGGVEVAVKCLDGFGSVKKSFIAEVETIGSIHHFNLVRLVGFCVDKIRMLLVYEYMCNGSLDQWIFNRDKALALGWQWRRKIIVDIAKGLAYLHEGCRQKIIHLDIKSQNILLDENFNAKVSDFGLAKLVGKEQSQVVTTMRGTPGYMAPEWLNSGITEKVDVYSFGIVVLEILCGRKNVDRSLPEEESHLVTLFKRKVEDGQLLDLVDKYNDDMQSNAEEVVEIMNVAGWCLQVEYARRPSMTVVLKALEGKQDDFPNPPAPAEVETLGDHMDAAEATTSLIASILSGPR